MALPDTMDDDLVDHGVHTPLLKSTSPVPDSTALDVVQRTPATTWRSLVWDSLDKSPAERRFLFKLDAVVLTFASLGYFIKYLDQVNLNNAFVSGMKEDLALQGNQLNYMIASWTVGYVLGEVPSNIILTRVRPSVWIPACEVVWAVLTAGMAACRSARQICALRFAIGLAESTFYPGMQFVIGSWYRRDELAKRSCIFHAAGAVGSMVSGGLMAAVHRLLDGRRGLAGWQWLFIADTLVSLPVAVAGFFLLPDVPATTRAWFFSADDVAIARRRMQLEGHGSGSGSGTGTGFTRPRLRRILAGWHLYALTALYVLFNNGSGFGGQPAFQLWLKSTGHSVAAVNIYPTLVHAVQIASTLAYAWTSDGLLGGARWPPVVFSGLINIVVYSSLAVWAIPDAWKWTCFFLTGFGGGVSGLLFAWAHEICRDDELERAIVTGAMNEMAYVFQAWLPLVVWQQVDAPYYKKGFATCIGIAVAMIATALSIRHAHQKELRAKKTRQDLDCEEEDYVLGAA